MEVVDLPFKVEYAKSGRAACKGCKVKIDQGEIRIAAMVQSAFHDGKQPNWHHKDCFFRKLRPSSVGDIENFENLRAEDQEELQECVKNCGSNVIVSGDKKGSKKRSKVENGAMKDFEIEYAKSGRAACRGCELKISKDQIRIRKTVYDTEVGMKYGGQALWHHVECFAQLRSELGWLAAGDILPGFNNLSDEDKADVKRVIPSIKSEDGGPSAKKAKLEKEEDDPELKKLLEKVKEQNKKLFQFRDNVKAEMAKKQMEYLLEYNCQDPIVGESEKLLDQVADLLTFGALAPCTECQGRQLLFQKSGYLCNGALTEWTRCTNLVKEPVRKPCQIPSDYKEAFSFLKKVSKKPSVRAIHYIPPSVSTLAKSAIKKDEVDSGPKVKRERPPLYNLDFSYIIAKAQEPDLKKRIQKLGGKCSSTISAEKTIAVFSTTQEIAQMGRRMSKAKDIGLHIIPLEYLDAVESDGTGAIRLISSMSLCDWGTDPAARVPKEDSNKSMKSKSIYTKSVPKSLTLKIKDGLAVDTESGLEDVAHVYISAAKDKYNVVLGLTDIQANKNSFYKLQLLESDKKNKYWVFRSWGRIGTSIGNNKLEDFSNLIKAQQVFKENYYDKTGNHFDQRQNFVKVPGRYYPIDIDYSDEKNTVDLKAEHHIKSKLQQSVQDIIKIMFDIDSMKRTMLEFDLDMEKMPLGKLSKKQIESAYKVLTEINGLIEAGGSSNAKFIDCTNRFYTLIPHSFGVESPPLLNTLQQIEKLREMLDSLLEIEYAYSMIANEENNANEEELNPIDKHYEQLKTKLEPLDKNTEEFTTLQKYVQNTHAATHSMYELEVVDIFKVARQGESRRYKPFRKMHNRRLLWHGSRLTNFAGILSHGLKIAPPEAPVTGYMFGKGIYFADMVSKSANYCCTSKQNSTGFMLLSEVALGDMMECTAAKYVTSLPKDKHSCFGRGRTMPNPAESIVRADGVEIPLGKPLTDDKLKSSLLYNEFIVYDIAQVNIQYMFHMNFNYKF